MSEARLLEITSIMCKSGGHIWPIVHLMELNEQERKIFLEYVQEYVKKSEYPDTALCYGIVEFSLKYLESKNVDINKLIQKAKEDEEREVVSYFETLQPKELELRPSRKK